MISLVVEVFFNFNFFLFSNWRFETDEKKKLAQTTNPASWLVDPSRRTNWSLARGRRREQKNRRREFRYTTTPIDVPIDEFFEKKYQSSFFEEQLTEI